jgi:hypothetical protein
MALYDRMQIPGLMHSTVVSSDEIARRLVANGALQTHERGRRRRRQRPMLRLLASDCVAAAPRRVLGHGNGASH